jgi:hypothetical protein
MDHPDEETLALLALGEDVGGTAVAAHVAGCAGCRAELAALRRVTQAGRGAGAATLERPSDVVWARIAAELGLPAEPGVADGAPGTPVEREATAGTPVAAAGTGVTGATPSAAGTGTAEPAAGRAARPRRRRIVWVAAASFVVGVGGTIAVQNLAAPPPARTETLAAATLEPLPGWQTQGRATVREVGGRRVLTVDLPDDTGAGYREVWLMDNGLTRLVGLGVLGGTQGQFDLPADLDLREFRVVDVSAEPYDGNPAHSGDSIVRGKLA